VQLALRRAYGYAYGPPRPLSLRGLGQSGEVGSEGGSLPDFGTVVSEDPLIPTVTVPNSGSLFCPDGSPVFSDGSCTETSAPSGSAGSIAAAAQVAAALSKAITPIISATGVPSCPAGYAYGAAGQSVQIAPGVATVGAGRCLPVSGIGTGQLISGVSNSTLGIAAIAFLALMMFSGGRRR
jgi:hypothetical protein